MNNIMPVYVAISTSWCCDTSENILHGVFSSREKVFEVLVGEINKCFKMKDDYLTKVYKDKILNDQLNESKVYKQEVIKKLSLNNITSIGDSTIGIDCNFSIIEVEQDKVSDITF